MESPELLELQQEITAMLQQGIEACNSPTSCRRRGDDLLPVDKQPHFVSIEDGRGQSILDVSYNEATYATALAFVFNVSATRTTEVDGKMRDVIREIRGDRELKTMVEASDTCFLAATERTIIPERDGAKTLHSGPRPDERVEAESSVCIDMRREVLKAIKTIQAQLAQREKVFPKSGK